MQIKVFSPELWRDSQGMYTVEIYLLCLGTFIASLIMDILNTFLVILNTNEDIFG